MLSTMYPIDWLFANAPGFGELPEEDRQAIFQFSLLWSLFEARALGTQGSANGILALVHKWASQGRLNSASFHECLSHFRARYFANGTLTEHFHSLGLRNNDNPALVQSVLKGEDTNPADTIAALLIVVYRLRNNLFHGVKWAYGISGQLANFTHANIALMKAIEIQDAVDGAQSGQGQSL
jgi:hypothetical protein